MGRKNAVTIDIGFRADISNLYQDMKKPLDKLVDLVEGSGISDAINKEVQKSRTEMEDLVNDLNKKYDELLGGKIDASSFDAFKKTTQNRLSELQSQINELTQRFDDFQAAMSGVDSSDAAQAVSLLSQRFTEFREEIVGANAMLSEFMGIANKKGTKLSVIDSSEVSDLRNEFRELNNIVENFRVDVDIIDEKDEQKLRDQIKSIGGSFKDLRTQLDAALKSGNSEEIVRITRELNKQIQAVDSLTAAYEEVTNKSYDFAEIPLFKNNEGNNAKAQAKWADKYETYVENFLKDIEARRDEAQKNMNKVTSKVPVEGVEVTEFSIKNGAITVPLKISTTEKGLSSQVNKILEAVQNSIEPIEVKFKLTSGYKKYKTDELKDAEDLQNQINNLDIPNETKQNLTSLIDNIREAFGKELKINIRENSIDVKENVRKNLEALQEELKDLPLKVSMVVDDESKKKLIKDITDVISLTEGDSLDLNISEQAKALQKAINASLDISNITKWKETFLSSIGEIIQKLGNIKIPAGTTMASGGSTPPPSGGKPSGVVYQNDTIRGTGYHAGKHWENNKFDMSKSGADKGLKMGAGMYLATDPEQFLNPYFKKATDIKKVEYNLEKCFILTNDYISSIEAINKILGTEFDQNTSAKDVLRAIDNYSRKSPENAANFRASMLSMGYQGMYVGDYLANKLNEVELVIYDEAKLDKLVSFTKKEFQELQHPKDIEIHFKTDGAEEIKQEIKQEQEKIEKETPPVEVPVTVDTKASEEKIEKVTKPEEKKVEVKAEGKEAKEETKQVTKPEEKKVTVKADTKEAKIQTEKITKNEEKVVTIKTEEEPVKESSEEKKLADDFRNQMRFLSKLYDKTKGKDNTEYGLMFNSKTGYSTRVKVGGDREVGTNDLLREANGRADSWLHTHPNIDFARPGFQDIEVAVEKLKDGIKYALIKAGDQISVFDTEQFVKKFKDQEAFKQKYNQEYNKEEAKYYQEHPEIFSFKAIYSKITDYAKKISDGIDEEFRDAFQEKNIETNIDVVSLIGELKKRIIETIEKSILDGKISDAGPGMTKEMEKIQSEYAKKIFDALGKTNKLPADFDINSILTPIYNGISGIISPELSKSLLLPKNVTESIWQKALQNIVGSDVFKTFDQKEFVDMVYGKTAPALKEAEKQAEKTEEAISKTGKATGAADTSGTEKQTESLKEVEEQAKKTKKELIEIKPDKTPVSTISDKFNARASKAPEELKNTVEDLEAAITTQDLPFEQAIERLNKKAEELGYTFDEVEKKWVQFSSTGTTTFSSQIKTGFENANAELVKLLKNMYTFNLQGISKGNEQETVLYFNSNNGIPGSELLKGNNRGIADYDDDQYVDKTANSMIHNHPNKESYVFSARDIDLFIQQKLEGIENEYILTLDKIFHLDLSSISSEQLQNLHDEYQRLIQSYFNDLPETLTKENQINDFISREDYPHASFELIKNNVHDLVKNVCEKYSSFINTDAKLDILNTIKDLNTEEFIGAQTFQSLYNSIKKILSDNLDSLTLPDNTKKEILHNFYNSFNSFTERTGTQTTLPKQNELFLQALKNSGTENAFKTYNIKDIFSSMGIDITKYLKPLGFDVDTMFKSESSSTTLPSQIDSITESEERAEEAGQEMGKWIQNAGQQGAEGMRELSKATSDAREKQEKLNSTVDEVEKKLSRPKKYENVDLSQMTPEELSKLEATAKRIINSKRTTADTKSIWQSFLDDEIIKELDRRAELALNDNMIVSETGAFGQESSTEQTQNIEKQTEAIKENTKAKQENQDASSIEYDDSMIVSETGAFGNQTQVVEENTKAKQENKDADIPEYDDSMIVSETDAFGKQTSVIKENTKAKQENRDVPPPEFNDSMIVSETGAFGGREQLGEIPETEKAIMEHSEYAETINKENEALKENTDAKEKNTKATKENNTSVSNRPKAYENVDLSALSEEEFEKLKKTANRSSTNKRYKDQTRALWKAFLENDIAKEDERRMAEALSDDMIVSETGAFGKKETLDAEKATKAHKEAAEAAKEHAKQAREANKAEQETADKKEPAKKTQPAKQAQSDEEVQIRQYEKELSEQVKQYSSLRQRIAQGQTLTANEIEDYNKLVAIFRNLNEQKKKGVELSQAEASALRDAITANQKAALTEQKNAERQNAANVRAQLNEYNQAMKEYQKLFAKSLTKSLTSEENAKMQKDLQTILVIEENWNDEKAKGVKLTENQAKAQKMILEQQKGTADRTTKERLEENAMTEEAIKLYDQLQKKIQKMYDQSEWRAPGWDDAVKDLEDALKNLDKNVYDPESFEKFKAELLEIRQKAQETQKSMEWRPIGIDWQMDATNRLYKWMDQNKKAAKEFREELDKLAAEISQVGSEADASRWNDRFLAIQNKTIDMGLGGQTLGDRFKNQFANTMTSLATYYLSFQDFIRYGRQAIEVVHELDDALVEMRKVSDESLYSLKEYQLETFDIADKLGTTAVQIQNSTADWLRLGRSLEESKQMAALSTKLLNVSEFENISDATDALVSATQAYKDVEPENIVSKLNLIGIIAYFLQQYKSRFCAYCTIR